MTQINLLPWREQRRHAIIQRFFITIGIFVVLTLIFAFIMHLYWNVLIESQKKNNAYLQTQVDEEQNQLGILNKKKREQEDIQTDLKFIFTLRENSFKAVRLLDALVRLVPDAVNLLEIKREGNHIIIIGKAQSDLQVTSFMENISKNKIFKQPELTVISSKELKSAGKPMFQIDVQQAE